MGEKICIRDRQKEKDKREELDIGQGKDIAVTGHGGP
jgi:hypothetical protein